MKYNCPEKLWPRLDKAYDGRGGSGNIGKGWYELVEQLDTDIARIYPDYILECVKEKFGGLRYYIANLPDTVSKEDEETIYRLIGRSEAISTFTCDVCGQAGRPLMIGWLVLTRCDEHKDKIEY